MGIFGKLFKKDTSAEQDTKLVPGVGRLPYPAYRGREPYLFVSYAHVDHALVFEEIRRFNEAGFHVWYDEGIAPGNEWTKEIAAALQNCALFVVMITPDSAVRRNVQNEINFAVARNMPFVAIHLKKTTLPADMELQIGVLQAILKYNMTEEEYDYKYITAFERLGLKRTKKPSPTVSVQAPASAHYLQTPASQKDPEEEIFNDSPEDAKKRANGDLVRVDGYDIEHGSLRGYYGRKKDLMIPNAAVVIPSTAFQNCRLFVESIDLNRAGCILDHAFSNCPKLHTVKVPPTVTTFKVNAFYNCPNVTLYVRRDQLPEGFEEKFTGKAIVYTDERTEPAETLPCHRFFPDGVAYITTYYGKVYKTAANALIYYTAGLRVRRNNLADLYNGMQTLNSKDGEQRGKFVRFCDMKSVGRDPSDAMLFCVTKNSGEEYRMEPHPLAEFWFLGNNGSDVPVTVKAADVEKITFDRSEAPDYRIRYCKVTTERISFLSPSAFLWLSYYSQGEVRLTKDLSKLSSSPLNLHQIKKITVTKNGTSGADGNMPESMEMIALLADGKERKLIMDDVHDIFLAMDYEGGIAYLMRETLKEIEFYSQT